MNISGLQNTHNWYLHGYCIDSKTFERERVPEETPLVRDWLKTCIDTIAYSINVNLNFKFDSPCNWTEFSWIWTGFEFFISAWSERGPSSFLRLISRIGHDRIWTQPVSPIPSNPVSSLNSVRSIWLCKCMSFRWVQQI